MGRGSVECSNCGCGCGCGTVGLHTPVGCLTCPEFFEVLLWFRVISSCRVAFAAARNECLSVCSFSCVDTHLRLASYAHKVNRHIHIHVHIDISHVQIHMCIYKVHNTYAISFTRSPWIGRVIKPSDNSKFMQQAFLIAHRLYILEQSTH